MSGHAGKHRKPVRPERADSNFDPLVAWLQLGQKAGANRNRERWARRRGGKRR